MDLEGLPYITEDNIKECLDAVHNEFLKEHIEVNAATLRSVTISIMKISYSTGGDYSVNTIRRIAEVYIKNEMYKK